MPEPRAVDSIILTEGGGGAGLGHVARCSAIAQQLTATVYVHSVGQLALPSGMIVYPWLEDLQGLLALLPKRAIVLIDSYLAKHSHYEKIKQHCQQLLVLDDYNRLDYTADYIINPGIKLPVYKQHAVKVLGGSRYIILREDIVSATAKSEYRPVKKAFVYLGGRDDIAMIKTILLLLQQLPAITWTVLLGAEHSKRHLAKEFSAFHFLVNLSAVQLAKALVECDAAILSGGQIAHEAAYLGVPMIGIVTAPDQILNICGYYEQGVLSANLSFTENNFSAHLHQAIRLMQNESHCRLLAQQGRRLIDGLGAKRIAHLMQGSPVPLC